MDVGMPPVLKANDAQLEAISREGGLSLNLNEMRAVQAHFQKIGRDPTDVEIETIAQTWSEHCVHKTFRGRIEYEENGRREQINSLLKTYIFGATERIGRDDCVSVFKDNAGVIRLDDEYGIAFKVETHNHPSAVEPYGGAGTGIGGVIRDILGTGLGAKPILNTDVFCFGPHDMPMQKLPKGVLHPKRVFKGVVAGVRDYGNRMGIPTANGAIFFDERYTANPIVYCGCAGLIPLNRVEKSVQPGDVIMAVGGRTGRDGIHGATFSSAELDETSESLGSVVQIGNPIVEKKMADALLQARDEGLFRCITDCGAGGFSSAVGEMGHSSERRGGAEAHLERAPLKYDGLAPWEIWLSEAQERMVLAVPPENEARLKALLAAEDVEAASLGHFTDTGRLIIKYRGKTVGDLDMEFLHNGLPDIAKRAVWKAPNRRDPVFDEPDNLTETLTALLAMPNIASKEWAIRQYDHEVQGGVVVKPLQGRDHDGPGNACVVQPLLDRPAGVVFANGMNPKYGDIDPYWMAALAIDEALRNVAATGGSRQRTALLDNFSWGNPDKPDRLGSLARAAKGCHDIAVGFGTPFISGKDSLYNEYRDGETGESAAIPGTLLISAVCPIDDVSKTLTMDAKAPGDVVYLVGRTRKELGGSHYYALRGEIGASVPRVRLDEARRSMDAVSQAAAEQQLRSAHDCSEGGLAVALAETAFAGGFGMNIRIPEEAARGMRLDEFLFSESPSRFVVTCSPSQEAEFVKTLKAHGAEAHRLGVVAERPLLVVQDAGGQTRLSADIFALKEAWQRTFKW